MTNDLRIGAVGRARQSVDAIRVLHRIRTEGRTIATDQERVDLTGWSGWGPLATLFAPNTDTWQQLADEVAALLPAEDLELGRRATYSAFYTPDLVARAMWKLLHDLGFRGGPVLEPGCGRGTFIEHAPGTARMVGVERDTTTAAIAALLHPDAEIINRPFERARLAGEFTAAIGNVPFGDVGVRDPLAPADVKGSLHNYFIWRTMAELAPGGIAVLLTSRYTMDATDDTVRLALSENAKFLGAMRLPNGALGGGTQALADIVVLRRRTPQKPPPSPLDNWRSTEVYTPGTSVNRYWSARPDMVLGAMQPGATAQWGLAVEVKPVSTPLPALIEDAAARIVQRATDRALLLDTPVEVGPLTVEDLGLTGLAAEQGWHDGSFHRHDGKVLKVVGGAAQPVARVEAELDALIGVRDLAVQLVALEADHDLPDADIEPVRTAAYAAYTAYEERFGAINRSKVVEDTRPQRAARDGQIKTALGLDDTFGDMLAEIGDTTLAAVADDLGITDPDDEVTYRLVTPRLGGFRTDPDFQLVAALEDYDDDTGGHRPAPILTARQNRRIERPARTDDPAQALAWSLDRLGGKVDLAYIARALGRPVMAVTDDLGDAIFKDPQTRVWVTAEEYLSGNVRRKLTAAETAASQDQYFTRNVAALQAVQPVWLEPHEITAQLGAPWIAVKYVEQFIEETLSHPAKVQRIDESNRWEVTGGYRVSAEATFEWGTTDMDAYTLIELALNKRIPIVKVLGFDAAGEPVMRKSTEKSMLAAQKQQELVAKFGDWIWSDPARSDELCHLYNHRFNATVARTYDGSHITIDGLAPWFKPYKHQLEYVARAVSSRASLCGHPVGAGKTAAQAMVAMKLKQLGLIRKPMISVPKHLQEQTTRKVQQLFPGARVLSVSSESIGKNRRAFAARCATGDWDIVIITHPAFDKLRVSEQTEQRYLGGQVGALNASIRESCPDGKLPPGMVKRAAKAADKLDKKITDLRHREVERDTGITFEMLGVDYLLIDESHIYKNLAVPCAVDGFSVKPSKRATDLDMKLSYLSEKHPGRPYVALFSGTPVSNTMLELYVVLHYLMPEYLDSIGLGSADAWAAAFVQFVTSVEVTVDGGGFQLRTRPSLFVNAPELQMLIGMCADIRRKNSLGFVERTVVDRVVVCEATQVQSGYSSNLVWRAEESRKNGRRKGKGADNMLKICTDGRRMATDPALVGLNDPEPGKLDRVADEMVALWREHPDALQLGFLDIGTPNDKKGDQSYGRLKAKLVERGMPPNKIRFIHDAKSGNDKAAMFAECRRPGGLNVILGSTDKLGVGTNIQDRAIAGHDIDAPMRPSDLEQRWGRVDRQGNTNTTVHRFRYITTRTFDAYLWQMLVRKASFIDQILTGDGLGRTVEDVTSDAVLSMSAIKASAAGQPLLMERATLDAKVKQLADARRAHELGVQRMRARVVELPESIQGAESEIARLAEVDASFTGQFPDDAAAQLTAAAKSRWAPPIELAGLRVRFGAWHDSYTGDRHPEMAIVTSRGEVRHKVQSFHTGSYLVKELAMLAQSAAGHVAFQRAGLDRMVTDLAKCRASVDLPFAREAELIEARARLGQIEAELTAEAIKASPDEPLTAEQKAALKPASAPPAPVERPAPQHSDFDAFDLDGAVQDELLALAELEQQVAEEFFAEL